MKLRRLTLGVLAAMALSSAAALPAVAADSSTTLTVNLTGAGLTISAPAAAALSGAATVGSTLTGALGDTTVTDSRGTLQGWTVTVLASGDLVDASTTPAKTISLAAGQSTLTWVTGVVTANGSSLLAGVSAGLGGNVNTTLPAPVAAAVNLFGGGSYSYNPTVAFIVPPNVQAGTYTTTLVQTVA